MPTTISFDPSSINCGVVPPGGTNTAASQCPPLSAPVNITAAIANDTSGGAITLVSVASHLPQFAPPPPPGPPGGFQSEPEILPASGRQGPPRLMGQSNGVTPLPVSPGEFIVVTVQFAPTASTPAVCTATLQIHGDTWNPVSLPITAAVGEIKVSVPAVTVGQGASVNASIQVTLVAGNATTADLYLQALQSPNAPNVTASLASTSLSLVPSQTQSVTLSVSAASNLATGLYFWNLGIWAFNNQYSFSVPVNITVGEAYYFIKSKLSGNVIDLVGASTKSGALLDAWPQKSSGNDNQLWEFVPDPAGSGYYFIKGKLDGNVIDIQGASTKPGTPLDAWPQNSSGTDNQLWEFVADPAGSGYCFIKSKLYGDVVDIRAASTQPGALLNAYPWKFNGYDNQLWSVVGGNFPNVVQTVPQRSGGDSGYFNYIQVNGSNCATLTGVKVTIYFTEDLVWESSSQPNHPGFSIQLNAETNNNQPLDWLQFIVHMGDDQGLWPWINIFAPGSGGAGSPSPLWIQTVNNPVAKMPQSARIPAGYSIIIALENDSKTGNVTGATWTVLDGSGASAGSVTYNLSSDSGGGVPSKDLCPIASFQVTFGGALDGAYATFSSGAGVMIFQADQAMTVVNSWPACIGYQGGTGESSNIGYGALENTPSTLFSQSFGIAGATGQARALNPNARKLPARIPSGLSR